MRIHRIKDQSFDSNIFLVEAKDPVLIDTGTGLSTDRIISKIESILDPKRIDRIYLTHRHVDHTGGAQALSKYCEAQLFASEDEVPSLLEGDQVSTGAWMFYKSMEKLDVKPIQYGEKIDVFDRKLEVLHTPGHTRGSICLYERVSRSLFSGDTVFANGGVGRWDMPTGSFQELLRSIEKLIQLNVVNLYPGHGPVVEGKGQEHIELSYRYLRLSETMAIR